VLNSSKHPTAALRFARFVAARDAGLQEFKETGFRVVDGDVWAETPKMTVFAGSVNRHALESILKEFEEREGAQIATVYDGCGILTAQMRTMRRDQQSGFPDAYMACDVYYLNNVRDWFQEDVNVTDTPIVLVVQKGNPKDIQSIEDLTKPGMRVVVGQPEQCTIGVLSKRLLEEAGIYERVLPNIVMQTTTSALLVPNITTLAADAVLAFEADTKAERDKLELIRIDSPSARAIQPYSIARSSDSKHMARRLYDAISKSRSRFEAAGFHWRLATPAGENDAATIAP
jgi:ABC-type molybdate transport system substrate-binding protein